MTTIRARQRLASAPVQARGGRPALAAALIAPPVEDNVKKLNKALDTLVAATAVANDKKNAGTREEKKAKENLSELMNANTITSHETMVEFGDGSKLPYVATIAPGTKKVADIEAIAKLCGVKMTGKPEAIALFVGMLSSSQDAVKASLGENAVIATFKNAPTLAALSVGKKKG